MPKFEVRVCFEFAPGQVDGVSEEPPPDLLDEKGKVLQPLGIWPQQNAKIEAAGPDEAIAALQEQWKAENQPIFLDERITPDRFAVLENSRRPGRDDCTSVVAQWMARPYGRRDWSIAEQNFKP